MITTTHKKIKTKGITTTKTIRVIIPAFRVSVGIFCCCIKFPIREVVLEGFST